MWWNLIPDEVRQNTEFIYSLSYGKDSFAGLHVTIDILGIPVHRIVHAEVWATDTIPADLPPMVEFKAKADAYIKARWGLTVEHISATRVTGEKLTYEKLFYHIPKRKDPDNPDRGGVHRMALSTRPLVQQQTQSAGRFGASRPNGAYGATATSRGQPYGFPISSPNGGNWCTQLKTKPFLKAPSGEGRKEISSIFWASQLMSRSVSPGT